MKKRVLIVDDALELGRFLQAALATLDYPIESVVVPSAEEAMLEAGQSVPDLLIADIRLPGISGLELVRKIRGRYPDLKVILITGMDREDYKDEIEELNVEAFLSKPMVLDNFLAEVKSRLGIGEDQFEAGKPEKDESSGEEMRETISDILSGLRKQFSAKTVFILDDIGRVRAQAGELPDGGFQTRWIPALAELLGSMNKVSGLLGGSTPKNAMTFQGNKLDLAIAPVGKYALILVLENGADQERIMKAFDEILQAQAKLFKLLEHHKGMTGFLDPRIPLAIPDVEKEIALEQEIPEPEKELEESQLTEFEALFAQSAPEVKLEDADTFWKDDLKLDQDLDLGNPDLISYDQARKLGLAPDEDTE